MLKIGDRVRLEKDTLMVEKGRWGYVAEKFTPAHCTGVWSISVKWDENDHLTSYNYPTDMLFKLYSADPADDCWILNHDYPLIEYY